MSSRSRYYNNKDPKSYYNRAIRLALYFFLAFAIILFLPFLVETLIEVFEALI